MPANDTGTIYLVRHAEKVTDKSKLIVADPRDPNLTDEGKDRAAQLSDRLASAEITAVWSTDYTRTRDTAAPLAKALGLEIQYYDPNNLEAFAKELLSAPGKSVLVVGHSNTTPQLVAALGGAPGYPIDEASEYDRLYRVNPRTGETALERYGKRYREAEDGSDKGQ